MLCCSTSSSPDQQEHKFYNKGDKYKLIIGLVEQFIFPLKKKLSSALVAMQNTESLSDNKLFGPVSQTWI